MSALVKIGVSISIFAILIVLIPFPIEFPSEIYNVLISDDITSLFNSVSFFLPMGFIFVCILFYFSFHLAGIFMSIVNWIYDKVVR